MSVYLCAKHYMQETIAPMAEKMPKVILTEFGLLVRSHMPVAHVHVNDSIVTHDQ